MNDLPEVLGGTLVVVLLVVGWLTIRDIFRRSLGMAKTAAWLLIVVLLPPVGAIAYWVTRKPGPDEVERVYDNERALRESARRRPSTTPSWVPDPRRDKHAPASTADQDRPVDDDTIRGSCASQTSTRSAGTSSPASRSCLRKSSARTRRPGRRARLPSAGPPPGAAPKTSAIAPAAAGAANLGGGLRRLLRRADLGVLTRTCSAHPARHNGLQRLNGRGRRGRTVPMDRAQKRTRAPAPASGPAARLEPPATARLGVRGAPPSRGLSPHRGRGSSEWKLAADPTSEVDAPHLELWASPMGGSAARCEGLLMTSSARTVPHRHMRPVVRPLPPRPSAESRNLW